MKNFIHFIFADGLPLVGLFFIVTFFLELTRERFWSAGLNERLADLSLIKGSLLAAMLGAVTPFCSCSTIPIFSGMLRSNIRFGVSFTFLLASPLISEIVVLILLQFSGIKFTLVFVFLAAFFPILFGIMFDRLNFRRFLIEEQPKDRQVPGYVVPQDDKPIAALAQIRFAFLVSRQQVKALLPHLTIGILAGGAIYGFMPQDIVMLVSSRVSEPVFIILMALLGIPLYLDMTAALPIGMALMEKGVPIGPIISLLVSGAGTSIPEMILLSRLFTPKLLLSFIAAVTASAICMGFFFSYIYGQ